MLQICWNDIFQANDFNEDKYLQQQCQNIS